MTPQTAAAPSIAETFAALVAEWREAVEVRYSSDPSAPSRHPAYRAMVDLGPAILPLIFAELESSADPGFLSALRELTGVDPVPDEERGYPRKMAIHWLAWGRARGLV